MFVAIESLDLFAVQLSVFSPDIKGGRWAFVK